LEELEEQQAYKLSNARFKQKMKYVRKRDKKVDDKLSNGSTTGQSNAAAAAVA